MNDGAVRNVPVDMRRRALSGKLRQPTEMMVRLHPHPSNAEVIRER
jgi:hypothetical protein